MLIDPDTAGEGAATRAQNRHPQRVWPADVRRGWARTPDRLVSVRKRTKPAP